MLRCSLAVNGNSQVYRRLSGSETDLRGSGGGSVRGNFESLLDLSRSKHICQDTLMRTFCCKYTGKQRLE